MKRVLIISYYWPPSGGSGVQRWLKFAKYLPSFGWQPVVFTPDNPDFNVHDKELESEVPEQAEIIKLPINEPYSAYRSLFGKKANKENNAGIVSSKKFSITDKLSNFIRGNFFIPDPKVGWVKSAVNFLEDYLNKNPVDVIVSTGPPHSMHLIALGLKKKLSTPWIADFRDPWSELDMLNSYHIMPFRFKKYKALEKRVLEEADLSLSVSKVWENDFKRLGAINTATITNGFDEEDFKGKFEPYNEFVISHFGLINHLRNPKQFWIALAELCEEDDSFNEQLKIHLGGTVDAEIQTAIRSHKILGNKLKLFPYISHGEVIQEYKKSSILLLLLFDSKSGKGNIPGKLFEYLACNKPIIAFGPNGGDAAEIVSQSKANSFFDYQEKTEEIKKELRRIYNSKDAVLETSQISFFSREKLTEKLVKLFEKMSV